MTPRALSGVVDPWADPTWNVDGWMDGGTAWKRADAPVVYPRTFFRGKTRVSVCGSKKATDKKEKFKQPKDESLMFCWLTFSFLMLSGNSTNQKSDL